MGRLSPGGLRSRLQFDFETVRGMMSSWLRVSAFSCAEDAVSERNAIGPISDGGGARIYRAAYGIPTLAGPGEFVTETVVLFDLLAGGNYPYSKPSAFVVSRPTPWLPHVHGGTGVVCLGDGWLEAKGRVLFAQLLVHVARILNLADTGTRDAFAAETLAYWQEVMGGKPITPNLVYPTLPTGITHGVTSTAQGASVPRFRPRTQAVVPSAAPAASPNSRFRPKGAG